MLALLCVLGVARSARTASMLQLKAYEDTSGSILGYIDEESGSTSSGSAAGGAQAVGESDADQESQSTQTTSSGSAQELLQEEYDSLESWYQNLTEQNQELQAENDQLNSELVNVTKQIDYVRVSGQMESDSLTAQIDKASSENAAYNRSINPAPVESGSSSDDNEYDMENSLMMTYVIALGTAAFFISSGRGVLESKLGDAFRLAYQKLLTSISVLGVICLVTMFMFFGDAIYDEALDMRRLLLGLAMFVLLWFGLGVWLIFAAQSISRYWQSLEDRCVDLSLIKEQLETVHELGRQERAELYRTVDYAVMRQEFINPTCTSPVTEIYLRPDFDFSEYLKLCLGDLIAKLFTLSWAGCVILIIGAACWRIVFIHSDLLLYVFFGAVPFLVLVLLVWVFFHLRGVFWALVPPLYLAREIELPKDPFKRQYSDMAGPQADFLKGRIPPIDSIEVLGRHPLNLTVAYIVKGQLPNRHELLFFLDRYGPSFLLYLAQGLLLILTAWVVIIVLIYIPYLTNKLSAWAILVVTFALFLWLWTAAFWVPEVLRLITLTTKIHQLKDRNAIFKASLKQKETTELLFMRSYRQFQQIFRDQIKLEVKEVLPIYIRQICKEVFSLITSEDRIHISRLDELLGMFGFELSEDELRVFAKECSPDAKYYFNIVGFETAVRKLLHSQRLKAAVVVRSLIDRFAEDSRAKRGKADMISLGTVRSFLNEHIWHFMQEDIESFMYELEFLAVDQEISVAELAAKVKDSIEGFPR